MIPCKEGNKMKHCGRLPKCTISNKDAEVAAAMAKLASLKTFLAQGDSTALHSNPNTRSNFLNNAVSYTTSISYSLVYLNFHRKLYENNLNLRMLLFF